METCWNGTCNTDYDDGVCPEEPDVNCDSCEMIIQHTVQSVVTKHG